MQSVLPTQANTVVADIIALADGTPIVAGTVNFYLQALTGTNAGKWWRAADTSWQAAEAISKAVAAADPYPDGHQGNGQWAASIVAGAWTADTRYRLYAVESGDLNIVAGEEVSTIVDGLATRKSRPLQ